MKIIEILLENTSSTCFLDRTNVSWYDGLITGGRPAYDGADYSYSDYMKFEKGVTSEIIEMTAKEYFDSIDKYIYRNPYAGVVPRKVDAYAEDMKNGDKFPMPYLNYSDVYGPGQEGRHRMLAMAKAFGNQTKAKVLVVTDADPSDDEIMEYAKKKVPEDPQWAFDYVKSKFRKEEIEEEPELDPMTISAIEIDEGDICDLGDGLVRIDSIRLSGSSDIIIDSTGINTGDNVGYVLDDNDEVTFYSKDRNPHLYK